MFLSGKKLCIHLGKGSTIDGHIECIDEILKEKFGKEYEVSDVKLDYCDDYVLMTNLPFEEYNRYENF